jgi:hypothetical protein
MALSIRDAERMAQPELSTWPSGSRLEHNRALSVRGKQVFLVEDPDGKVTGTIEVDPDGVICTCKRSSDDPAAGAVR